jgi:hypothetical protein
MTPEQFSRLKKGDRVLVVAEIGEPLWSNEFEPSEPRELEAWHVSTPGLVVPDEIMGYATDLEGGFIVGDRVRWCDQDGYFIIHIIPSTREAIILHDMAAVGPRRTALSRLERVKP